MRTLHNVSQSLKLDKESMVVALEVLLFYKRGVKLNHGNKFES